jgi:hypothetical protein
MQNASGSANALSGRLRASGVGKRNQESKTRYFFTRLCWSGDFSEVAAPDPIPNSAVKRLSADGTASMVAGE